MRSILVILVATIFVTPNLYGQEAPPTASPAASPSPAAASEGASSAEASAADPKVVAILEKLESQGDKVNTARCKVKYTEIDRLNITEKIKPGEIRFRRDEPHPVLLVRFDTTWADGVNIGKDQREWWLLRDRWLYEAKEISKTITKRQIAAADQEIDFFDLEKSPFPLPFGQQKEQILKNFDVRLVPAEKKDPEGCDHLVCMPKPSSVLADEYRRMDFYIDQNLGLPRRIILENADGNMVRTGDFTGLDKDGINIDLPASAFALPPETDDFEIIVETQEGAQEGGTRIELPGGRAQ